MPLPPLRDDGRDDDRRAEKARCSPPAPAGLCDLPRLWPNSILMPLSRSGRGEEEAGLAVAAAEDDDDEGRPRTGGSKLSRLSRRLPFAPPAAPLAIPVSRRRFGIRSLPAYCAQKWLCCAK